MHNAPERKPFIDKEYILSKVGKALDIQFEGYSWTQMIDDIISLSESEREWAKKHIAYKAYIWS